MTSLRRFSSADGRSVEISSAPGTGFEDSDSDEGWDGGGYVGLGESAYRRTWDRILHWTQIEGRTEVRLENR